MRDIVLENLKSKYSKIDRLTESDKRYLTEAKKKFSHLTESYLLENKPVIDNIRKLSVSARDIMNTFHVSLAAARTLKKSYDAFAIAEHFARTEEDVDTFNEKLNESCKVILELEGEFDPNKTLGGGIDVDSGADQFDPNAKIGGAGDFGGDAKAMSKAKPDVKSKEEKKKGFLTKVKEFLGKAAAFVKTVATSKATYKVLAIGAVMVILGVVAATIGGWVAVGFGAVKGLLGLFAIFKGSKELIKTADYAQGKKGLAGVAQWIKSAKDPKNAAKILLGVSQIALGAWGASSAISGIMNEIATMDAMKMYNPEGAPTPAAAPEQAAAPAEPAAPEKPAAPEAPAAAPDMSKYTSYGASKASALQSTIQQAAIDGNVEAMSKPFNALANQVGEAVRSGKLTPDQGEAIFKGFAEQVQRSNGGLSASAIFKRLLSAAKLG
jgi:hypothetical protein